MNSIGNTIHDDFLMVEQEVSAGGYLSEGHIVDIKVDMDYREAAGKVARMDPGNTTNAMRILEDNVRAYHDRLRHVLVDMRRSRSLTSGSDTGLRSTPTLVSTTSSSSYKPYMERLKAPLFSGRVED